MARGRPPKYKTPAELESKINEYFEHIKNGEMTKWIDKRGQVHNELMPIPPTIAGIIYS